VDTAKINGVLDKIFMKVKKKNSDDTYCKRDRVYSKDSSNQLLHDEIKPHQTRHSNSTQRGALALEISLWVFQ